MKKKSCQLQIDTDIDCSGNSRAKDSFGREHWQAAAEHIDGQKEGGEQVFAFHFSYFLNILKSTNL